jgi:thioredoxin 1
MAVVISTVEEYNSYKFCKTRSSKLMVVKFGAEWCGPCKKINDEYNNLHKVYNATFLHVDVDELADLPDGADVQLLPTFKFFKNGVLLETFSGSNITKLKSIIDKLLI